VKGTSPRRGLGNDALQVTERRRTDRGEGRPGLPGVAVENWMWVGGAGDASRYQARDAVHRAEDAVLFSVLRGAVRRADGDAGVTQSTGRRWSARRLKA